MTAVTLPPSVPYRNSAPSMSGANLRATTTPILSLMPLSSTASRTATSATGLAVSTRYSLSSPNWESSQVRTASSPLPLPVTPLATERSLTPTVHRVSRTSLHAEPHPSAVVMARSRTHMVRSATTVRTSMVHRATRALHPASATSVLPPRESARRQTLPPPRRHQ